MLFGHSSSHHLNTLPLDPDSPLLFQPLDQKPALTTRPYMYAADDFLTFNPFDDDFSSPELNDLDTFSATSAHASPNFKQASNYAPRSVQQQTPTIVGPDMSSGHNWIPDASSMRTHRRALSNSSTASYGSVASRDFMHAQQYPNNYPTSQPHAQAQAFTWDDFTAQNSSGGHNLPTPARTPVHEPSSRNSSVSKQDGQSNMLQAAWTSKQSRPTSHPAAEMTVQASHGNLSPATPQTAGSDFDMHNTSHNTPQVSRHNPIFAQPASASASYRDDLYYPTSENNAYLAPTSHAYQSHALHPQQAQAFVQQRLQAAQQMRASPQSSQFPAAYMQNPGMYGMSDSSFVPPSAHSATAFRQHQQSESEAQVRLQSQRQQQAYQDAPTVSPKDAFPKQDEPAERPSLFGEDSMSADPADGPSYAPISSQTSANANFHMPSSSFDFATADYQAPAFRSSSGMKMMPQQLANEGSDTLQMQMPDFPAHLISMETTKSESEPESASPPPGNIRRPTDTRANRGVYSCTYQGCPQRFTSQKQLQQHKKEAHRSQATHARQQPSSMLDTQNGPHRCTEINPATNKPCNKDFSRPYDLTRHEETIHGSREKVQCQFCKTEKLFSRADALTRHLKLVHNELPPGKTQKRRGL